MTTLPAAAGPSSAETVSLLKGIIFYPSVFGSAGLIILLLWSLKKRAAAGYQAAKWAFWGVLCGAVLPAALAAIVFSGGNKPLDDFGRLFTLAFGTIAAIVILLCSMASGLLAWAAYKLFHLAAKPAAAAAGRPPGAPGSEGPQRGS
jgi:hypothetical protein